MNKVRTHIYIYININLYTCNEGKAEEQKDGGYDDLARR